MHLQIFDMKIKFVNKKPWSASDKRLITCLCRGQSLAWHVVLDIKSFRELLKDKKQLHTRNT